MPHEQMTAYLHTLNNADGSATYISPQKGYTIIAGVNYPVEVPYRSDEIPDSTYIEINLRPHNGIGMVKERHVEDIVRRTLQAIVLGESTPRLMLQVTLQITDVEIDESLPGGVKDAGQGQSYLNILTGCINAAVLACLDAGVQMNGIAGATLIGIRNDGSISLSPSLRDRKSCQSLHALAFNSRQECLLMESEGIFDLDQCEHAHTLARRAIIGVGSESNGVDVDTNGSSSSESVFSLIRRSVEERAAREQRRRQ